MKPMPNCRRLFLQYVPRADSRAAEIAGTVIAARMLMITMTTSISTKEKPVRIAGPMYVAFPVTASTVVRFFWVAES